MKKQVVVQQIEITQLGHIQVCMAKQVLEDDDITLLSEGYHRTSIDCGGDIAGQMKAVNEHLLSMGWPVVSDSDIADIQAHATVAWTPARVAAWQTLKASQSTLISNATSTA